MAACIIRAIWSDAPPAPAATTISTGLVGSHATAGSVASTIVSAVPAPRQIVLLILSSLNCTHARPRPAAALLVCWSDILPLCARGSRALAAVERSATLRRSLLPRPISPPGPSPEASRSNVVQKVLQDHPPLHWTRIASLVERISRLC